MLLIGFHRYFEAQHYVIRGKFPASRGSIMIVSAISGALMLTGLLTLGLAPEIGSFLMIGLIVAANLGLARGFLPNRAPGGGFAVVYCV